MGELTNIKPQGNFLGRTGTLKNECLTTNWGETVSVIDTRFHEGNAWVQVTPTKTDGWVKVHDFDFED